MWKPDPGRQGPGRSQAAAEEPRRGRCARRHGTPRRRPMSSRRPSRPRSRHPIPPLERGRRTLPPPPAESRGARRHAATRRLEAAASTRSTRRAARGTTPDARRPRSEEAQGAGGQGREGGAAAVPPSPPGRAGAAGPARPWPASAGPDTAPALAAPPRPPAPDGEARPRHDGVPATRSEPGAARPSLLVVVLVVVLGGIGYFLVRKNSTSTPTTAPARRSRRRRPPTRCWPARSTCASPTCPPAGARARAGPGRRAPAAPAEPRPGGERLASCLEPADAVVVRPVRPGPLPGPTSLVQSPMFQSAAGSGIQMASRTTVLTTAGNRCRPQGAFTNPKFDTCYQQFQQSLAAAAAPGSTAAVQPVTLSAPAGRHDLRLREHLHRAGSGTQVVGDAFLLGGRVDTLLQPTTDGPAVPSTSSPPPMTRWPVGWRRPPRSRRPSIAGRPPDRRRWVRRPRGPVGRWRPAPGRRPRPGPSRRGAAGWT